MDRLLNTLLFILLVMAAVGAAYAQPAAQRDPESVQVAAALNNARQGLANEILSTLMAPNLTVEQFLDQTGGRGALDKLLDRAEQVGGPRWVGQVCQVRLEISGTRVAQMLIGVAAANPQKSPMPADALARRLSDWNRRTFAATGVSLGAEHVALVRPIEPDDAWTGVDQPTRQRAVESAKEDAVRRILQGIAPVSLDGQRTLGELLEHPAFSQHLHEWLSQRPVTAVRFQPDLHVELTLAVSPEELADAVVLTAGRVGIEVAAQRDGLRQELRRFMPDPVGVGRPKVFAPSNARPSDVLPARPPAWVWRTADAEGIADPTDTPLRTARLAEEAAMRQLRGHLRSLTLSTDLTLGQLADREPAVNQMLERALLRARITRVNYLSDGRATVRLTVELRPLWEELRTGW